jgi:hypothetical protein
MPRFAVVRIDRVYNTSNITETILSTHSTREEADAAYGRASDDLGMGYPLSSNDWTESRITVREVDEGTDRCHE